MLLLFLSALLLVSVSRTAATRGDKSVATLQIQALLRQITSWQTEHKNSEDRPFVTLTYAQSIDGKIALIHNDLSTSSNFALSDPESLRMTHALRSIHDAILVGGRTLSVDNPRLNNRLWNPRPENQPRPILLDTHLTHIRVLGNTCRARNVLVCCSQKAADTANGLDEDLPELLPCPMDTETGRIDVEYVLKQLRTKYQIKSVMVEGGARVLSEFYKRSVLVDCICITVAPKILLWNGLPATSLDSDASINVNDKSRECTILGSESFDYSEFFAMGNDSIFLAKLHQTT